MNRLDAMRDINLPVTWRTVLMGWDGPGKFGRLIDTQTAIEHAERAIASGDTSADVVALASTSAGASEEVDRLLRRLAKQGASDLEERKWRALLLQETLGALPQDPIYALLALTSFWEKFGFPKDSPHVVQGRDNEISPGDYYTNVTYQSTLDNHRKWIANELKDLQGE